ncbi:MAG: type II secretion system protein [Candidatus Brocadiia bacterium]
MWRRLRGRRGATPLETTIVIILFGVLLSIIMPAIGLVRENALAARCQRHLQVLGQAIEFYMSDYRYENWLPASHLSGGQHWFERLEPFVSGHEEGRARENFVCPRAEPEQRGFAPDTISYGWNQRFLPFGTLSNKVINHGETIVIADSQPAEDCSVVLPADAERPRLATRHREEAGVLFLAGNVELMTRAEAEFEWPRYWDRQ